MSYDIITWLGGLTYPYRSLSEILADFVALYMDFVIGAAIAVSNFSILATMHTSSAQQQPPIE